MSCYNRGGVKEVCDVCNVIVTNVYKHKKRNRCIMQHHHPSPKHVKTGEVKPQGREM